MATANEFLKRVLGGFYFEEQKMENMIQWRHWKDRGIYLGVVRTQPGTYLVCRQTNGRWGASISFEGTIDTVATVCLTPEDAFSACMRHAKYGNIFGLDYRAEECVNVCEGERVTTMRTNTYSWLAVGWFGLAALLYVLSHLTDGLICCGNGMICAVLARLSGKP
jgi:hypothetical protein